MTMLQLQTTSPTVRFISLRNLPMGQSTSKLIWPSRLLPSRKSGKAPCWTWQLILSLQMHRLEIKPLGSRNPILR